MYWTDSEARDFIKQLTPRLAEIGYCVAVFGSLAKEYNGNDLDLIVFGFTWKKSDYSLVHIYTAMQHIGCTFVSETVALSKWTYMGKPIDLLAPNID